MSDRFQPTRAGVINVWDYVDEEWVFADGRLALRGHNGSGKTKALEVLFPFVLDGVADSRPLTDRQLKALLEPDTWRRTATEYRDLVDFRLFGLGRDRYAQLLDLLLALRRPLLAKDLDPAKVSDTLSSGLSPVDEDLVQQAARDFENLAAVQKLFDDFTAANAAVQDFLTHYSAYLRAHVKFRLDRLQARAGAAAEHAEKITVAAVTYRRPVETERQAEKERDARRDAGETLQGRLAGPKNSDEDKAQGRIEDKRPEMRARAP